MFTPSLNTQTKYCVVLDLVEIDLLLNFYKKSLLKLLPRLERMRMANDGRGPLKDPDKLHELKWLCHSYENCICDLENYLKIMENTPLKMMDLMQLP